MFLRVGSSAQPTIWRPALGSRQFLPLAQLTLVFTSAMLLMRRWSGVSDPTTAVPTTVPARVSFNRTANVADALASSFAKFHVQKPSRLMNGFGTAETNDVSGPTASARTPSTAA